MKQKQAMVEEAKEQKLLEEFIVVQQKLAEIRAISYFKTILRPYML